VRLAENPEMFGGGIQSGFDRLDFVERDAEGGLGRLLVEDANDLDGVVARRSAPADARAAEL